MFCIVISFLTLYFACLSFRWCSGVEQQRLTLSRIHGLTSMPRKPLTKATRQWKSTWIISTWITSWRTGLPTSNGWIFPTASERRICTYFLVVKLLSGQTTGALLLSAIGHCMNADLLRRWCLTDLRMPCLPPLFKVWSGPEQLLQRGPFGTISLRWRVTQLSLIP